MLYWSLYLHWMSICKIPWSEILFFYFYGTGTSRSHHSTQHIHTVLKLPQWMKVHFSSVVSVCHHSKRPYQYHELHPISQKLPHDWWWPFLALSNSRDQEDHWLNASSFNATFLQVTDGVMSLALCLHICLKILNILQQTSHSSSILPSSK